LNIISISYYYFDQFIKINKPAEVYQYGLQYWIAVFGMLTGPLIGI